jgi:hypothetical protein
VLMEEHRLRVILFVIYRVLFFCFTVIHNLLYFEIYYVVLKYDIMYFKIQIVLDDKIEKPTE